jgi:hypothetical protein
LGRDPYTGLAKSQLWEGCSSKGAVRRAQLGEVAPATGGRLRNAAARIRAIKDTKPPLFQAALAASEEAKDVALMRTKLKTTAALLVASLGGCTTSLNIIGDPFMAPAKFQFLRCEDIAKRLVATQARERELRGLMDRASVDTGGSAVNMLVYQPDYRTVQSELRQLHETAVDKQCPDETSKADAKKADPNDAGKPR